MSNYILIGMGDSSFLMQVINWIKKYISIKYLPSRRKAAVMCFILLNIYTRTYQTPRQSKYLVILPCYVFSFVTCSNSWWSSPTWFRSQGSKRNSSHLKKTINYTEEKDGLKKNAVWWLLKYCLKSDIIFLITWYFHYLQWTCLELDTYNLK